MKAPRPLEKQDATASTAFVARLPMPPSANNMFVNAPGRRGGRFPSGAYKEWKKLAGATLLHQWLEAGSPRIAKPYSIYIELNINHQSDIFNREKAITDLLVATIPGFPDDCWINRGVVERNRNLDASARVTVEAI